MWAQIERGVGGRLHFRALQIGDERCNRTAYGAFVGDRYVPLLDEDDPRDETALVAFLRAFGGLDFAASRGLVALRVARGVARHPAIVPRAGAAAWRFVRRAGGLRAMRRTPPRPVTYVMHSFMDARLVRPAWAALREGRHQDPDPEVQETIDRLRACSYAMSHPEEDLLVPACAQHSVLDPLENRALIDLLGRHRGTSADAPAPGEGPLEAVRLAT